MVCRIGSVYFSDSGILGCTPLNDSVTFSNADSAHRLRFSIGPIVRREFWEKERSVTGHQGPCTYFAAVSRVTRYSFLSGASPKEYLQSIADREIEWIRKFAGRYPTSNQPWQHVGPLQHSMDAHIASLNKLKAVIPYIVPQDADLARPRFWHPDFHAGNIYVDDDGNLTAIIDWQGAWTTPPFIGINPPSILDYGVEMLMKLPENFKSLDDGDKEKLRYQVSQSILITAYETRTAKMNPPLDKMMRTAHGQTLKQLEAFANATWDNCLYPLNECLLRIQRYVRSLRLSRVFAKSKQRMVTIWVE